MTLNARDTDAIIIEKLKFKYHGYETPSAETYNEFERSSIGLTRAPPAIF